jgi:hypothetical protein
MNVELSKYRILPGKEGRVDQWIDTLHRRYEDALETLEREEMQLEVIFRESKGDTQFLYWFSIQKETGEDVESSPHDLDRVHMAFWNECIDKTYRPREPEAQLVLVPRWISKAVGWGDPKTWTETRADSLA